MFFGTNRIDKINLAMTTTPYLGMLCIDAQAAFLSAHGWEVNVWEAHGHARIYVNATAGLKVDPDVKVYLDFIGGSQDDIYDGSFDMAECYVLRVGVTEGSQQMWWLSRVRNELDDLLDDGYDHV